MRIRRARTFKGLKTRRESIVIIGGEGDFCTTAAAYCVGGKGITPARKFARYNAEAKITGVQSIGYFDNIKAGVALTESGQVYRWSDSASGAAFTDCGTAGTHRTSPFECTYNSQPAAAVVSGTKILYVLQNGSVEKDIPYELKGACLHMGRIFAVDARSKYVVRWSGIELNAWTQSSLGAGYISLNPVRGEIYRVVSMGENLYVYREFGVDVIKAYGDPRHFAVAHQGSGEVTEKLEESACAACGDKLYFCSQTNVYRFNGNTVERVKIPGCMKGKNYRNGSAFDGRYVDFYCERVTYGGSYQFEMDLQEGTFAFYALSMPCIWKTPTSFYGWKSNSVYREDETAEDMSSSWRSDYFTLGDNRVKTLKSIYLESTGDIEITVHADRITRRIKGGGSIPVDMSGRQFYFNVGGKGSVDLLRGEWEVRE